MLFLSPTDNPFDIQDPKGDTHFCVLDYSNENDVDYKFLPAIYAETYEHPVAQLAIGPYTLEVPPDWWIVIGDKNSGELELIEISTINEREFDAFLWNPLSSYAPEFPPITLRNILPDREWIIPKTSKLNYHVIPLREGARAPCALIVKDGKKFPDLDIGKVMG